MIVTLTREGDFIRVQTPTRTAHVAMELLDGVARPELVVMGLLDVGITEAESIVTRCLEFMREAPKA